jgi:hypothetical protein
MLKSIFSVLSKELLSDTQLKSVQNLLNSKNLYYTENITSSILLEFKKNLVKIGTTTLKDKKTIVDMFIEKKTLKRVILIRENDKELFITSSL